MQGSRYYACESMYNIAKVAKGEILVFFNDVFDALCKLAADSELSVKNGAELLDRLVKDIVHESASTYVSVLDSPELIEPSLKNLEKRKKNKEKKTPLRRRRSSCLQRSLLLDSYRFFKNVFMSSILLHEHS